MSTGNKLKELLKSRKFWAAFVGLGMVIVKAVDPKFPLEDSAVTSLVYIIVAYILGTGLSDVRAK
jgi:hypothetical protein